MRTFLELKNENSMLYQLEEAKVHLPVIPKETPHMHNHRTLQKIIIQTIVEIKKATQGHIIYIVHLM